jgi:hypothetical protein
LLFSKIPTISDPAVIASKDSSEFRVQSSEYEEFDCEELEQFREIVGVIGGEEVKG